MASSESEKIEGIIEKLGKLKHILKRLAFYRQQEANIDSANLTRKEAFHRKVKLDLQRAKERLSEGVTESSLTELRLKICKDLVPLESFITENSLAGVDDSLKKIYDTIQNSAEPQEIQKLINDFTIIDERAKVKSKTPDKDGQDETKAEPEERQSITLQQFFKDYCDLSNKPDITSKREMLLREDRNGRIKLSLVGKKADYRPGQTYLFFLDELLNNWPAYRKTLTTLPPLKKSGNK